MRRAARVAVRASSSEENAGETLDDDLPPPIKLTADQARIAALAFEVLYEKDPVEDLEEMLKDKERPGLRLKLQQAIEGCARSSSGFVVCRVILSRRFSLTVSYPLDPFEQLQTRCAKRALPSSVPSHGKRWTVWRTPRCARE